MLPIKSHHATIIPDFINIFSFNLSDISRVLVFSFPSVIVPPGGYHQYWPDCQHNYNDYFCRIHIVISFVLIFNCHLPCNEKMNPGRTLIPSVIIKVINLYCFPNPIHKVFIERRYNLFQLWFTTIYIFDCKHFCFWASAFQRCSWTSFSILCYE